MPSKNRNLVLAAGVAAVLMVFLWQAVPSTPATDTSALPQDSSETPPLAAISPTPLQTSAPQAPIGDVAEVSRTYSIGLHELSGLTELTAPGTRIDIWASWGPPLTKRPQVQRLLRNVTILRIQPPFLPEGPVAVVLSLSKDQVESMVWGDKYGSLAAVVIE